MPIRLLSVDISSQISSGEIITQPCSVVKELMENSIDAGAKNIHVNIEKGGLKLIHVKDDGIGIKKKELLLSIARHATSKIVALKDLNCINTFGFRGEALASIRAVSRFTIISSTLEHEYAWKIYSEGYHDKNIDAQPIAHPLGTSVLVEDLFYNLPVRLKFIKSIKQEYLKIYSIFNKIALSHFHINFLLRHNKKIISQYYAISNKNCRIQRLEQIFHPLDTNTLLMIQSEYENIQIFGWISSPQDETCVKKNKYCYVNNRYVHNNTINNAVNSAYKNFSQDINFFYILYIFLPSNKIDINIHPTKKEIKFHDTKMVFRCIYAAIMNRLNTYFSLNKFQNILCFNRNNIFNKLFVNDIKTSHSEIRKVSVLKKDTLRKDIIYRQNMKIINTKQHIFGKLLIIIQKYYGLMHIEDNFVLISFPFAQKLVSKYKFQNIIKQNITPEFILTDIKIDITFLEYAILLNYMRFFLKLGIRFILKIKYVIIQTIPVFLNKEDIKKLILKILKYLKNKKNISIIKIINWFYINTEIEINNWNYAEGLSILLKIERFYPFLFINPPSKLLQKIDINSALRILKI